VLATFVRELIELDDDGLCCGSGGSFSLLQPTMAGQVRDRKIESIERARADVVASANPGCSLNLVAGGATARHPMMIVDEALSAAAR
jgi:glycolate oxidase iron-sulfur subunit